MPFEQAEPSKASRMTSRALEPRIVQARRDMEMDQTRKEHQIIKIREYAPGVPDEQIEDVLDAMWLLGMID